MHPIRLQFALAAALAKLVWTGAAFAHGPPAAVTGIVATAAGEPKVVAVSEGLAERIDGHLRYICPTQFGTELSPLALSIDGLDTFVVGDSDLYVLHADGTVTAQNQPALARQFVAGLGAVNGRPYVFRVEDGATEIRPIGAGTEAPIFQDSTGYGSISFDDDGFWVARASGGEGRALHLDGTGAVESNTAFPIEPHAFVSRVQSFQGKIYVSLLTAVLSGKLLRVAPNGATATVLDASAPLLGPVVLDASDAFVVADGVLEALDAPDGGWSTVPFQDQVTCIGRLQDLGYACSRTKLFSLGASGPSAVLVDLSDLEEPLLDRVDPDSRDDCSLQWLVFQNDLRTVGALPPASIDAGAKPGSSSPSTGSAKPPRRASSGCEVVKTPEHGGGGAVALLVGLLLAPRAARRLASARA